MNDSLIRIGIDRRDNIYYVARLNYSSGRPDVKALLRLDKETLGNHDLIKGDNLIFSIEDDKLIYKKLHIDFNDDKVSEKVSFELSQSILENENDYIYDYIETSDAGKIIGMVVNCSWLEKQHSGLSIIEKDKIGFVSRSIGLAKGYMTFCQQTGGELVALLDFNLPTVSIALLYQNKISDFAYVKINDLDNINESDINRLAVEIKTMLNFKQASLGDDGINLPISAIIVSGYDFEDKTFQKFKDCFNLPLSYPEINPAYFNRNQDTKQIPLEKYLVALGLAVK